MFGARDMEHRTNFYAQLSYDEYKELERQLRDWDSIETSHTSVDGYYHKALRIKVGTILFEFQGPLVKAPLAAALPPPTPEIPTACNKCGGELWDNRKKKVELGWSPKSPDFACKSSDCDGAAWINGASLTWRK